MKISERWERRRGSESSALNRNGRYISGLGEKDEFRSETKVARVSPAIIASDS